MFETGAKAICRTIHCERGLSDIRNSTVGDSSALGQLTVEQPARCSLHLWPPRHGHCSVLRVMLFSTWAEFIASGTIKLCSKNKDKPDEQFKLVQVCRILVNLPS